MAPFQPFAEALGRYFQSVSADRISRMPDWQLTELSRLVLRLREYAPSLEEDGGDPESDRFRFFEAVTATLNELSASGTILLVVDDLHCADQPTLLLLRHVLRSADDARLGIIGVYIDTEVAPDHRLRPMLRGLPGGASGRDGPPAGPEPGGGGGAGAALARRSRRTSSRSSAS